MSEAAILLVEDSAVEAELLRRGLVAGGYRVTVAGNGREALEAIGREAPALVMSDVNMPLMDGFALCRAIKQDAALEHIPVILLSTLCEPEDIIAAIDAGADSYLTKPYSESGLFERIASLLATPIRRSTAGLTLEVEYGGQRHRLASDPQQMLNLLLSVYESTLAQSRDLMRVEAQLRLLNESLEEKVRERSARLTASFRETIHTLTRAAAYRDEQTGAHVLRVASYCELMAEDLGMDAVFRDCLHYAIPLHDLGKIAIPDAILLKPGGFTAGEWEIMKSHAEAGARMLEGGESPYLRMGHEVAWCHHERWDGGGYPRGLAGEAIPLAARLMQLADVYDALRSRRPYKPPVEHAKTVEIILDGDARVHPEHFDPALLAAFGRLSGRFEEVFESLAEG